MGLPAAKKPCVALSHQAAVLNKKSPHPDNFDPIGKLIIKNYAPANVQYGFHFRQYDKKVFTPVIRAAIRNAKIRNKKHYTVYLPAYSDKKIIKVLSEIKEVEWQVFSKISKKSYVQKNIIIVPINNDSFVKSMASSAGVLCGAGFETPAEALFLEKKLMVIPMKGQYEQQCNAAALKKMDIPVLKNLKKSKIEKIIAWVKNNDIVEVDYPNVTDKIIDGLFKTHSGIINNQTQPIISVDETSEKKLNRLHLGNNLYQMMG